MSGEVPKVIADALKVPGARVTIPVSIAKEKGWSLEWIADARKAFESFHMQMGGDHALYYAINLTEFFSTGESPPHPDFMPLERAINPTLGSTIKTATSKGKITLDQYMADPLYRAQGIIMIHKGKVVYEQYPGMEPSDRHLTASTGKITVGIVIAQLLKEGKIDGSKPIIHYVPQLEGTAWDTVPTSCVYNMCTALNTEETIEAILDPKSPVARFIGSCAGSNDPIYGKPVDWLQIARETAKPLSTGEKPGEVFRYSSINTTVLTQLVENVEKKPWKLVFEERVWSKVGARRSICFHESPGGMALPTGFVSVTPEDYARFALLFTPSWHKTATENVAGQEILDVIYANVDKARYTKASKLGTSAADFNDPASGNAVQFDYIWEDGAIAKSGNLCQMVYIDPKRDFVSVFNSTTPFVDGYGEFKAGAFQRIAAKFLNGDPYSEDAPEMADGASAL